VYAGYDPVSGRRHYLREVVPPGPKAAAEAEKVLRRFAGQVDERRNPRTGATVDQLLDRHLETLDVSRTTHRMYKKYLEKHVRPFIGRVKAGAVDADVHDSLYAELRRCRTHCANTLTIDHRTPRKHVCDERPDTSGRCGSASTTASRGERGVPSWAGTARLEPRANGMTGSRPNMPLRGRAIVLDRDPDRRSPSPPSKQRSAWHARRRYQRLNVLSSASGRSALTTTPPTPLTGQAMPWPTPAPVDTLVKQPGHRVSSFTACSGRSTVR
jgi:hypothetical protein